jgi:hypothetical protein
MQGVRSDGTWADGTWADGTWANRTGAVRVSENRHLRKLSFRESLVPETAFPRMEAVGSSVNTASSRSYGAGVAPHDPGSIGPGLGGLPRT